MPSRPSARFALSPLVALLATTLALAGAVPASAVASAETVSAAAAPNAEPHGVKGEYFLMSQPGARDFDELAGVALDAEINFPGLVPTFTQLAGQYEHVTARWTGQIEAPTTEDYTFYAIGDNGFRLFIDDVAVIDHWEGDWDVEQTSAPITLAAGERHDFRLEYFQDTGGANMFLRWSTPSMAKQIVPESALYPPADFEIFPVEYTVAEDGLTLRAAYLDEVGNFEGLAEHLTIESDTTMMPVAFIAVAEDDTNALVVTLDAPIQKSALVRVAYDGDGALTVGGETVPSDIRNATNESTHRLLTEWGENLDSSAPLQEYPRPQLERERWMNLNGEWEFAGATAGEQPTFGATLDERITVPFPVESQLSGLERHEDYMFYRKLVSVPAGWQVGNGERLMLNFGAVDNRATVWVNGIEVASHTGGYDAFSADITDALVEGAPQEVVVAVEDTLGDNQPHGKQSRNPSGIVYTQSSGIWQTVWLEPVADAAIDNLIMTPDIDDSSLSVTVESEGASDAALVTATASNANGEIVGTVTGQANELLQLPVDDLHLWSPDDPYLYDLTVTLAGAGNGSADVVDSYFGMRSVGIEEVGGYQKLVLNGEPIFSLAMLDQGWWPDGLMTAPSDEALRFDLEAQKDLGFNAVRKHIKVEPARWYYHADQLGLLVWQDFVSGTFNTAEGQEQFLSEGWEMMAEVHNAPSVIGFIPFNEGWGEWNLTATGQIAEEVKAAEPTRIVNAHSGMNCCASKGDSGKGDIVDHHDYTNTEPPFPDENRAAMDGEHGGFTLRTPGHMWPGAPAAIYSGVDDQAALTAKYVSNTEQFYLERARTDLSGSVYTQITDLETEINGLWTYDRKVLKVDGDAVREVNERVIAAGAAAGEPAEPVPGRGYWPLDEGEGTASADEGLGESPLTLAGGAQWTEGIRENALSFNGDGQYAETDGAVVDTLGSYTVSAWVTLDELPGNYATAVSQDGLAVENPFYLQYGQGAFAFSFPGGNRARIEMTPELNEWYHLVGVHDQDESELRLFIDGELVATTPADAATPSSGSFAVGRGAFAQAKGDWWSGLIDEVRVFDNALSAEEISALYAGTTDPEEPADTVVTPGPVTFTDVSGADADTFRIPAAEGVEYLVNGEVVAAGTHPGSASVTITVRALEGYVLAEGTDAEWTFEFSAEVTGPTDPTDPIDPGTDPVDPTDPGTDPTPGTGTGSGDGSDANGEDLASTGANVGIAGGIAFALLALGGLLVYRRRRVSAE